MHPTPRMHIYKNRYAFAKFFLSLALSFTLLLSMTSLMLARSGVARDAITITSQTQQVHFPDSIDFSLTANDAGGKITQAVLYIQAPYLNGDEVHVVTAANPGTSVHLAWHEDMQKADDFFSPGTPISYHWEIEDNAGADHTGTTQKFDVNDQRFAWQETDVQQFQIKYYNSDGAEVQALRASVDKAVKRLTSNLGGAPTKSITLWIYKDTNAFKSALPPDTEEWVGGIAFPDIRQGMFVVEDAQDNTLIRDMPHEMSHLVLHELTDGGVVDIPRWLDEGLAVYNQEYHEGELSYQLRQGLKSNQILRLSEIEDRFPSDSNQAYLAYAQSWDLVTYMYNTFGQAKMHTLIKDMGNSSYPNFDEDLKASLGLDEAHLENAWRLSQHQSSILTPDQEKQDPQPTKQVVTPSSNNLVPYSTLLLVLGIFLLVSPGFAFAGYAIYRRQVRIQQERKLAIAQAQRILDEAHWGPGPQSFTPIDPYAHYTNPGRYTQPGSPLSTPPAQPGNAVPPFPPPGLPHSGAGEQFGSFTNEE
ncbi:hypothetical protein KSC_051980 [Ktedonobacter sp. SOSP1-52]|uniref:peptidase MA family metallohydrolase n=1 Tax=Ktedonobacter sp. SOSP1-52 TaxID=2778366 RepID=UPI00191513EF|nr:peptidase MA family metallohydrolase [Ktedonobacter sp. SOSP1-52]GHO66306.1 hypothetical protein KSC_051980 [Ktedonobacter sp. SOSP1-52]